MEGTGEEIGVNNALVSLSPIASLLTWREVDGEMTLIFDGGSLELHSMQAKTLCRYGCMYFLAGLVLVCVDVIVMSSA